LRIIKGKLLEASFLFYGESMKFLKVYIEITNVCNLNCSFCSKTSRESKFMKIEEFEKVVDEVKEYTSLVALHIKGEPLMHPELEEILKICKNANLRVNITTNATFLLQKLDIILSSKSVRQINLSLHAIEQNNIDKEKYISNVFKAVDEIHRNTNIIISYRLWNLKELASNKINEFILLNLARKYNIENIIEKAKENEFIELNKNIFLNQDLMFDWPDMKNEIISKTGKCYGLRNQIGILANGDVVPCCLDGNGDIVLGNILHENLDEILEKPRAKAIISGFERQELVEELCQKCGFIQTRFNKQ